MADKGVRLLRRRVRAGGTGDGVVAYAIEFKSVYIPRWLENQLM